ncbi:MAG: glycosyltransferase family 2 protein [bacterium]|nr:glycosyltransferase family 2 protein [bacterium]
MPRVSIIVPTYNRPHLLERALCSIMQQTFRDFEVIVVNDAGCSVENHVRKFKAFSIKTINLTANGGSSIARNKAIECASGKYIAYLDDDDIFYPNIFRAFILPLNQLRVILSIRNVRMCLKMLVAKLLPRLRGFPAVSSKPH